MKKHLVTCFFLLFSLAFQAQEKWSLRQCIDYAILNNIEIKQQVINMKNVEIELSTNKNSRLPDLNANVGQNFSFGRSISSQTNNYEQMNSSRTSLDVSTSFPIFTGFKIHNQIKKSELDLKSAIEGLEKAKQNLELQVTSLYLDVLFKKELLNVYCEQIDLVNKQVSRTQILFEAGKVPKSQLYDIISEQAKNELNLTTAQNDLTLSLLNLAQALNILDISKFDIRDPKFDDNVFEDNMKSLMLPDQIYQKALAIKPLIKEAEYNVESSKRALKVAQSAHYPSLNLSAGYGTSYQNVSGLKNEDFKTQIKDQGSEYIGLTLNIPIFNRFQTRNQVRSARLNIENQQLILDNVKLSLYKEIQQAYQSAIAAQVKYISTDKAYSAAEESYKYAIEKYDVGKSTVFEFSEVQTNLLSSKSEQIQAKYDFLFKTKILDFYNGKPIDIE